IASSEGRLTTSIGGPETTRDGSYATGMNRMLTLPSPPGLQGRQHRGRGVHFGPAGSAAGERHLVAAPLLPISVPVPLRRVPCRVGGEMPVQKREREQRRAGQGGDRVQRPEPPRVVGDGGTCRDDRGLRLRRVHYALCKDEARAERLARPG